VTHGSVQNKKTFPMIGHLLKTKLYKPETIMFHDDHLQCSVGFNKGGIKCSFKSMKQKVIFYPVSCCMPVL